MDSDCYRYMMALSVGGESEAEADEQLDIKEHSVPGAVRRREKRWRIVGIFQHGWPLVIAALLNNRLLLVKPGRPEAWPRIPDSCSNGNASLICPNDSHVTLPFRLLLLSSLRQ